MQNVALLLNIQHTYYYLFKNLSLSLNIKLSQSRGHACLSVAVSLTPRRGPETGNMYIQTLCH